MFEGPILAVIIIAPVSCIIGIYQCFNNGELPFINIENIDNHNRNQITPES